MMESSPDFEEFIDFFDKFKDIKCLNGVIYLIM